MKMKKQAWLGLLVVAVTIGIGSGCVEPKAQEAVCPRPKHVVLVGFDGLAAWCVREHLSEMPTLRKMMDEGAGLPAIGDDEERPVSGSAGRPARTAPLGADRLHLRLERHGVRHRHQCLRFHGVRGE